MDCTFSEHVGDMSKPGRSRSLPHTAIELQSYLESWDEQRPKRRIAALAKQESRLQTTPVDLSIYGDEFHRYAASRPATAHFPLSLPTIDATTYQRWPKEFTATMKIDYQSYKDVANSSAMMGAHYNRMVKIYGGLQRMTETQHRDMLELCKGTFDDESGKIRPSAMVLEYYRSVCALEARLYQHTAILLITPSPAAHSHTALVLVKSIRMLTRTTRVKKPIGKKLRS